MSDILSLDRQDGLKEYWSCLGFLAFKRQYWIQVLQEFMSLVVCSFVA